MKKAINRMRKNLSNISIAEKVERAMLKEHIARISKNLDMMGM